MKDVVVYVEEIKNLKDVDEVMVWIDPMVYYKLLRSNKISKSQATAKVTETNKRKQLFRDFGFALDFHREIFSGLEQSWNDSRKSLVKQYLKKVRFHRRSSFFPKLPE